jgi:hypothetical protein
MLLVMVVVGGFRCGMVDVVLAVVSWGSNWMGAMEGRPQVKDIAEL